MNRQKAMQEGELTAFLEAVKINEDLRERLLAAEDNEAVIAIARAEGFSISVPEMNEAMTELSEQDLEAASGGLTPAPFFVVTIFGATAVAGAGGVIALTVSTSDCASGGGKGPAAAPGA